MTDHRNRAPRPRVSVISIFLNAQAFLAEAVDSVLAQNEADFELLLVDDGSTDRSTELAQDYARRDPQRIRYLEHPGHLNRGMSASRNLGIELARGEFIAFIDADDRWRPHKLREQITLLDTMPNVDAVCGAVNYWASWNGGEDRIIPTAHVQNRPIRPPQASPALYPLGRAGAPSMSDLMFRRRSILAVGGFEERFAGAYEDQAFLAKFYLESVLYATDGVWSDYRLHEGSCMAKLERDGRYEEVRRDFLSWFEGYLKSSRRKYGPSVRLALARGMLPYRRPRLHRSARWARDVLRKGLRREA